MTISPSAPALDRSARTMADSHTPALLSVRELRIGFHGGEAARPAVDGLSFDLQPGGALAIVGESGSGKTVSVRSLLQLLPENAHISGTADFDGIDLLRLSGEKLRSVRGRRIGMVFQNAMEALNPTLTLKRQLTEHLRWHGICGRKEALRRAVEALDRVGIPEPQRRIGMYPFQLSGGMRQRAMIAMAIVAGPTLLIADEPTTALDVTIQRQVLDLLAGLRRDGLSLLMITHDLGVARYACDDVIVMRHGKVVERGPMSTFAETAVEPYSSELLSAALDITAAAEEAPDAAPDAVSDAVSDVPAEALPGAATAGAVVSLRGLAKEFEGPAGLVRAVDDVDLDIARGETVGVVGESGSGKSTLARLVMGLIEPDAGSVTVEGRDLSRLRGRELLEMRRSMQMVFQNPYGTLLPHLTVEANVAEPLRVHHIGDPAARRARADELLIQVGIPQRRFEHYPRQFSGGQQQRVSIARALALNPQLLICDEPTSALDVSIQAQILELLAELKTELDLSMLFVTHNLAVAQQISDRIVVMRSGRVVEVAPTEELFANPAHPYTRALLAAVLPVRGEPAPHVDTVDAGGTSGALVEISPGHLARVPKA